MEMRNVQKNIENVKQEQVKMEADIKRLQEKEMIQDHKIKVMQCSIKDMKEEKNWLRRAITNAIIVSVIGGMVAIFFAAMSNF